MNMSGVLNRYYAKVAADQELTDVIVKAGNLLKGEEEPSAYQFLPLVFQAQARLCALFEEFEGDFNRSILDIDPKANVETLVGNAMARSSLGLEMTIADICAAHYGLGDDIESSALTMATHTQAGDPYAIGIETLFRTIRTYHEVFTSLRRQVDMIDEAEPHQIH